LLHKENTLAAEPQNPVFRDSIVIDGCSFFATAWSDRQETSGVTALQMTVPMTWSGAREALHNIHQYYALVEKEPRFTIIKSVDDIRRAKAQSKVGFILGAQNAQYFEYDPAFVEDFYRAGVRVTQLTYNERNLLGDGCLEPSNVGLSKFGKTIVAEMNRVGMQVDLSHVGERTTLDAMEHSTLPCIFSHSNPKARADNPRNITDEQIKKCAESGGVVGLTSYAPMVWMGGAPPFIDDVIEHIEYVVDLVGIDAVSFGTDSEVTPGSYPQHVIKRLGRDYPEAAAPLRAAHPNVRKTDGFESMESFEDLSVRLLDRGWSETDLRKLLGENVMRVYGQNWEVSA
jgi:membrane dipeptidase